MKSSAIAIFAFWLLAGEAPAADLRVEIRDAGGKPVDNAVVTYTPSDGVEIRAKDIVGPFTMAQKDIKFEPYVLAVPKGAVVNFPNLDRVSHHVYSFSPTNKFQLPLYGKGVTRSITFSNAGTAALACNIHDKMAAYIRVVDTPYFVKSAADGVVVLKSLPEGRGVLKIWHPLMVEKGNEISRTISIGNANSKFEQVIRLRPRGEN